MLTIDNDNYGVTTLYVHGEARILASVNTLEDEEHTVTLTSWSDGGYNGGFSLNKEMARGLITILRNFVDTGTVRVFGIDGQEFYPSEGSHSPNVGTVGEPQ